MNLFLGFLYGFIAQTLTFIQLQGPMKWDLLNNHKNWLLLLGLPVSWLFMNSVKNFVLAFDGLIWPSRLIGFSIGITVFTIMSQLLFAESLTLKTGVCLLLGMTILVIQLYWK
jgi:hypothetical protein